jgi:Na+/phosphate symporter
VIKALQNIKDLRRQMTEFREKWTVDSTNKDVMAMMDSIGKKMTEVEEALHQTKAKSSQDVLNYPIRLDDKLSNIYGNAAAGYGVLSKQSKEAYAAIGGQIDGQLNKLKNIVEVDIVKLNKMIREKTLPVIGLKKEEKKM